MEEAKKLVDKDIDDLERYFSESSMESDDKDPPAAADPLENQDILKLASRSCLLAYCHCLLFRI
jgi:hypothetical protein